MNDHTIINIVRQLDSADFQKLLAAWYIKEAINALRDVQVVPSDKKVDAVSEYAQQLLVDDFHNGLEETITDTLILNVLHEMRNTQKGHVVLFTEEEVSATREALEHERELITEMGCTLGEDLSKRGVKKLQDRFTAIVNAHLALE